jgi:FAD synthase
MSFSLHKGFAEWKAINEAVENGILVMTFGRFNPPTIGHQWLFQQMLSIATRERGVGLVFASHTQDAKRNPLPYDQKCKWLSKLIPKGLKLVRTNARNMQEILTELKPKQFRKLILVVGDDRTEGFAWVEKYKNDYGFQTVDIRSSGARSGASKIENASGTAMRDYARKNDYASFREYSPFSDRDTESLYSQLRAILK